MRKFLTSATLTAVLLFAGDASANVRVRGFVINVSYMPPAVSRKLDFGYSGAVKCTLKQSRESTTTVSIILCTANSTSNLCPQKSNYSETALLSMHSSLLKILGMDIPVVLETNGVLTIGQSP